jgi:RNA recognition motif-containing protein
MGKKVYVGNLPEAATAGSLSKLLAGHGGVVRVKLISDRVTGRSLGYAFVEMETAIDAERVIKELHGTSYNGWELTVRTATPNRD